MSPLLETLGRAVIRIFGPRRKTSARDFAPWKSVNADNRAWFEWAKKYLAWFDGTAGSKPTPVLH